MSFTPHRGPVRIGVIGLGFMGRTHVAAIEAARRSGLDCRLVAVCDGDERRRRGEVVDGGNLTTESPERLFDAAAVRGHADPAALLADPDVDLVHICTWTDTHVELALAALAARKHVIVEKPVALSSAEVARVADVARGVDRLCMPAMCMRWWPGWPWLREAIRSGRYGAVRSAVFHRLGTAPTWNDFYGDESRSGGALFDLHIHDVDFIRWCFGEPEGVSSSGSPRHLTTFYRYATGPNASGAPLHVVAEGGWSLAPSAGFRMQYLVCFDDATVEFDLSRPEPLVVHRDDRSETIPIAAPSGYEGEVMAAVQAIVTGDHAGLPTMDDAVAVTRILEGERAALL